MEATRYHTNALSTVSTSLKSTVETLGVLLASIWTYKIDVDTVAQGILDGKVPVLPTSHHVGIWKESRYRTVWISEFPAS